MRNRARSLATHSEEPPRCLCSLLQSDQRVAEAALSTALAEWQCLLRTESLTRQRALDAQDNPLKDVLWARAKLPRYLYLLLEAENLPTAEQVLRHMFSTLGDEKVIEDIHQHLRDLDHGQRHEHTGQQRKMAQMLTSKVLAGKQCAEVQAAESSVMQSCTGLTAQQPSLAEELAPGSHAVPPEWQRIMGQKTWSSPTPESLYKGIAAWRWIVHFWQRGLAAEEARLEDGWAASLLQFQDMILDQSTGAVSLVISPGAWGPCASPWRRWQRAPMLCLLQRDQ